MTLSAVDAQEELSSLTSEYSAHNYHPLPVVVSTAEGCWVTGVDGRRYLDMLAGYSALNFGHLHPRLVAAATRQLSRVSLVSRAFDHDQFGPFCAELAELCSMDMVLPMNTGAEAVESAIKVARKWGYVSRGVPHEHAPGTSTPAHPHWGLAARNHAHADAIISGPSTPPLNRPGEATAMSIGTVATNVEPVTTLRTGERGEIAYQIATPTTAMMNDGCSAL